MALDTGVEEGCESPELGEARRWFTAADEAGDTGPQYNLGVLLATGLDPPDLVGARRWFTTAAEALSWLQPEPDK